LQAVGMPNIHEHERVLHRYLISQLGTIEGLRLVGAANEQASVQSFLLGDIHPHDLGTLLDHQGIAVRTGHHCAMPVMQRFGLSGTTRASLALYNNTDDVDRLIAALEKSRQVFA
jgi:cysteine desulfurase/selenocysteine lyase